MCAHLQTGTHAACTHWYRKVNRKWGWGGGWGYDWQWKQKKCWSLVHGLRRLMWFWIEFWTGILLQHSVQSTRVYCMRQGPDGKKCVALWNFSFVLESGKCGCQLRNAMNGMGCTGEGQTSTCCYCCSSVTCPMICTLTKALSLKTAQSKNINNIMDSSYKE